MTELERLDHVRSGCLLDHGHNVPDLVRRGLVHYPHRDCLPYLTTAGVERQIELRRSAATDRAFAAVRGRNG